MPQPGGVSSGFKHVDVNDQDHETRLYVCHGKHVVHVKEASYLRDCLLNLNMAIIVLIRLATLQPGSLCSIVP